MKADQERVKNLLIDTVTLLCKNSLTYEDELCVEGLLGVKVDQKDVFFVHISETFPSALSVQRAQEAARLRDEEAAAARLRDEEAAAARLRDEDGDGPGTPGSSNYNNKRGHSDSPAHRDSPQSQKRAGSVNIKTENVDSGDDCCITDEPPVLLRTPGSVGAHPAHKVAGQRRPVHSPRSPHTPQQHTDGSYQDQPQFPSNSGYGQQQDYPEFSNVGKHEAREHGEGEPPRKRLAMSGDDEDGGEDDSYSGSQWPNLAGVHGIGDFAGQVAQQAFQDSGDSQMSGGGGDMTGQPGCSTWPTGLQQPAGDTTVLTIDNVHTLTPKTLECVACGRSFATPQQLTNHMRRHTGERPYNCHLCDYTATTKGNLKSHLTHRHNGAEMQKGSMTADSPGRFACHLCEFRAAYKGTLKSHLFEKHGGAEMPDTKGFKCYICRKAFPSRDHVKIHLRTHTGERPFLCHLCDYKSTTKGNLKAHLINKHNGAAFPDGSPIGLAALGNKCTQCDKYFQSPFKLKMHSRSHTGERPFACHLCDYRATQRENLKTHIERKHAGAADRDIGSFSSFFDKSNLEPK